VGPFKKKKSAPLPKTMTYKEARSLLEANGWKETQGGNHGVKMVKEGCRPVTLPTHHREKWSVSMTQSILKQAGLR
jgi:predicted RNA binding protein YcfA (HicA-like mRNA interferase family)